MAKQLNLLDKSIPPGKMIVMLAWPVFIEQLMQIMVSYVDTAMVGSIGINATAAVSVNSSFIHLTMGLIMGIATGYSVLVSRSIGEKRIDHAKEIVRQSLFFILGMGIVMMFAYIVVFAPNLATMMNAEDNIKDMAKDYLMTLGYSRLFYVSLMVTNSIHRGAGNTKISMRSNLANNLINCVGNFLLIYPTRTITVFGKSFTMWGAGLEVRGAAIATSVACTIAAIYSFAMLYDKASIIAIRIKDKLEFSVKIFKDALNIGIPVAIDRVIVSTGQMVVTRLCAGLGNATLAAHNYANTAESMCYMPILGFQVAAQTLIATSLGAEDVDLAKKYCRSSIVYAVCVMTCCAVTMYITAPSLIGFFTKDAEVISMGAAALRIQAFAEPLFALSTVCGGVLKGSGDARYSVVVSIIGMWCVRILLATILIKQFNFNLTGVWIAMAMDWLARAIVIGNRVKSGKWQNAWKIKES